MKALYYRLLAAASNPIITGTQIVTAVSYLLYLSTSIYGVTTMKIGMNYVNLLPDDTITTNYLVDYAKYLATSFSPAMEVMLPPTDMSQRLNQRRAIEIVQKFENGEYTSRAKCWIFEFLPFYERQFRDNVDFYILLNEFVQKPGYAAQYAPHIKYMGVGRRIC